MSRCLDIKTPLCTCPKAKPQVLLTGIRDGEPRRRNVCWEKVTLVNLRDLKGRLKLIFYHKTI